SACMAERMLKVREVRGHGITSFALALDLPRHNLLYDAAQQFSNGEHVAASHQFGSFSQYLNGPHRSGIAIAGDWPSLNSLPAGALAMKSFGLGAGANIADSRRRIFNALHASPARCAKVVRYDYKIPR